MTERLIAKLDRLGAEAGIKEMTPEIYQFAQLLNDEKMKQWDEWKAKREWVGLTDEEIQTTLSQLYCDINQMKFAFNNRPQKETVGFLFAKALEAKLKEKNNG